MPSSGSDSDSGWDKELITAVTKKQGKGKWITEEQRCRQIQGCLHQGANINTVDKHGNTTLHAAVKRGFQLVVEFLLQSGAKADIPNRKGETAIRLAENLHEHEIATLLKRRIHPVLHRSTELCEPMPSTSRASDSIRDNSHELESTTPSSDLKRIADEELGEFAEKIRKLELADVKNRRLQQNTAAEVSSVGRSSKRQAESDDDHGVTNATRRLRYDGSSLSGETYDGSGLKLSLHGTVYQLKHLMLILHRAWRMGYTFRLATEMDAAEKFDDVVLHYRDDKGDEVHRFIQAKHKQDATRSISARDLLDVKDGEFDVLKYFVSWRKIKRHPDFGGNGPKTFILCTNIGLDEESLKEANIVVTKITEPDDFLRVTNRIQQPPRYQMVVDKRSILYDKLKLASNVNRLARELADRVCGSKDIHLTTDIMKSYHLALVKEVVDGTKKKLFLNFIENKGLSKKAEEFRKSFFLNVERLLHKKYPSEKDIRKFLEQASLQLSSTFGKKQSSTKSEITQFTELPGDYINDAEISDFLEQFVLAVNQPNEIELGEMIKNEIGAESQFNLLDAGFLRDSFQNLILDWFKEKQGKFLKNKDAESFFYEMEVKIGSLITTALSFEHSEKLQELGIEFNCEHAKLLNFVNSPNGAANQILEFITSEQTLLMALRVYQSLERLQKGQKNLSFIFVRLETLLLPKIMEQVLRAFEWPGNHNLLVVDCESTPAKQYSQLLWNPLCEIMKKNVQKKMIIITQRCEDLATQLTLGHRTCHEVNDYHSFRNLTYNSRKKLLRRRVTKFQGHRTETSFGELLGIHDLGHLGPDEVEDLSELIDSPTLFELINSNDGIKIGNRLEGLGKISKYYIERIIRRYVIIKEDALDNPEIPDLLAVSGVERAYLGKWVRLRGNTPLGQGDLVINSFTLMCIDRYMRGEDVPMEECPPIEENSTNLTYLDGPQEEEEFKALCAKNVNRNVHWIKKKSGKYVWQESRGDITHLLPYRDERESKYYTNHKPAASNLSTDQLAAQSKRVIISDKAGMGKTVLLAKLAWKLKVAEPDMYVVKIDLNHNWKALVELRKRSNYDLGDINGAVNFLVEKLTSQETSLGRKVLKMMIKKHRKVALIFDGFDEISPTHEGTVIRLLKTLADHGISKLFCSTRPHTREELECKMNAFSYELKPLSAEDQTEFLMKYWKNKLGSQGDSEEKTKERIEKYAQAITRKLAASIKDREYEFTGIPLQAKLVGKIFGSYSEVKRENFDSCEDFIHSEVSQPKFPEKMNLIYLYELFVDKKFEIYFKKTGGTLKNEAGKEFKKLSYDKFMDAHKKLALQLLFDEETIKELLPLEENEPEITKERTGIITKFIDGRPLFGHRSYAEYFAAKFISDMLKKSDQNEPLRKIFVADILLKGNYENIRAFIDWLLLEENNIRLESEYWKYHVNDNRNELNETIFHVSAKEGNNQIIRLFLNCMGTNPQEREAIINVKDSKGSTAVHQAVQYGRIESIGLLVEGTNFNINSQDTDGMTPLHIAAYGSQLEVIKYLHGKGATVDFRDNRGWAPLHIAAGKGNIETVKYLIENGASVSAQEHGGMTPLHVASQLDQLEVVKYLIAQEANVSNSLTKNCWSPLHFAAHQGRSEIVKYLLDKGADVDVQENDGRTALVIAAHQGKLDVVKCLVEYGANVSLKGNDGWMPLHAAVQQGHLKVVKYLLDNGADVDSQQDDGLTPLHQTAQAGLLEMAKYLLDRKANVHSPEKDGRTPLHVAVFKNKLDIVKYLLSKGANINSQDNDRMTPLHVAVIKGHLEVAKYLLENGADVESQQNNGLTPLHLTAQEGQLDMAKYLLDKGANINSRDEDGRTPLRVAVFWDKLDVLKYLLVKGGDVNAEDKEGCTLLYIAVTKGNLEVVKYLLDNGADVNYQKKNGRTSLHSAAYAGQLDIAKFLLDNGANINFPDNSKWTPLHLASSGDKLDVVKYLLSKGADVYSQEKDGWTPLHIAVSKGLLNIAKYLIDVGVNLSFRGKDGLTPIHLAADSGQLDIAKYLLEKGADVNARDDRGRTSLHIAAEEGELDVIKYLLDNGANVCFQDDDGKTPLDAAIVANKSDVVDYLQGISCSPLIS